jgi:putative restriction endonuclease
MKLWVGTTDNGWFDFLARRAPDEVNFWQPGRVPPFKHLPPGTPFLFKLKRPHNHIAGVGFFLRYELLPLSVVWETFEEKNGASTRTGFERLIRPLLNDPSEPDPWIGASMLSSPVFFPREEWLPPPPSWAGQTQRGKTFDTETVEGRALWEAVQARLAAGPVISEAGFVGRGPRYGAPVLVQPRYGQSSFRASLTSAYRFQCAITGETTLPTLEAAHIRPYKKDGTHDLRNGLLLRADFHKLFDRGLVTVTPEHRVVISGRIRDQWFNGKAYYRLQGEPLKRLPDLPADRPDPEQLRWHNENVFEKQAS